MLSRFALLSRGVVGLAARPSPSAIAIAGSRGMFSDSFTRIDVFREARLWAQLEAGDEATRDALKEQIGAGFKMDEEAEPIVNDVERYLDLVASEDEARTALVAIKSGIRHWVGQEQLKRGLLLNFVRLCLDKGYADLATEAFTAEDDAVRDVVESYSGRTIFISYFVLLYNTRRYEELLSAAEAWIELERMHKKDAVAAAATAAIRLGTREAYDRLKALLGRVGFDVELVGPRGVALTARLAHKVGESAFAVNLINSGRP